jgi:hypothetical protein
MSDMFTPDDQTINLLVDLAMETEVTDPIDWNYLAIDEKTAYRLMATHVIEMELDNSLSTRAIIVKLLVENFVLNLKLLQAKND